MKKILLSLILLIFLSINSFGHETRWKEFVPDFKIEIINGIGYFEFHLLQKDSVDAIEIREKRSTWYLIERVWPVKDLNNFTIDTIYKFNKKDINYSDINKVITFIIIVYVHGEQLHSQYINITNITSVTEFKDLSLNQFKYYNILGQEIKNIDNYSGLYLEVIMENNKIIKTNKLIK